MISPNKNSKSIYIENLVFSIVLFYFFPSTKLLITKRNVNERNLLTIDRNLNFFSLVFVTDKKIGVID